VLSYITAALYSYFDKQQNSPNSEQGKAVLVFLNNLWGARNRVGIGLSSWPARLHSLAESESILRLLRCLKILAQVPFRIKLRIRLIGRDFLLNAFFSIKSRTVVVFTINVIPQKKCTLIFGGPFLIGCQDENRTLQQIGEMSYTVKAGQNRQQNDNSTMYLFIVRYCRSSLVDTVRRLYLFSVYRSHVLSSAR
jgi:hypothetical protein